MHTITFLSAFALVVVAAAAITADDARAFRDQALSFGRDTATKLRPVARDVGDRAMTFGKEAATKLGPIARDAGDKAMAFGKDAATKVGPIARDVGDKAMAFGKDAATKVGPVARDVGGKAMAFGKDAATKVGPAARAGRDQAMLLSKKAAVKLGLAPRIANRRAVVRRPFTKYGVAIGVGAAAGAAVAGAEHLQNVFGRNKVTDALVDLKTNYVKPAIENVKAAGRNVWGQTGADAQAQRSACPNVINMRDVDDIDEPDVDM
ncbi:Uncharacterized protein PBTT_10138 [Plasmodiophora brassicae]|uniref:Uncharacterized protein n=1 Tax=Plasmodiophora brassicae TaxID=37360 RepID=A0A0G4INZ9_PLABS|nr:hypothetical protein PBRA_005498 [Plasmodiophora brassicae]SPR01852.1 unnamed protein product [Plasmodiophora brassicae]